MKKAFLLTLSAIVINQVSGQNFESDFKKYQNKQDTANQLKTLLAWEKAKPNDAELFTAYFNYYFAKSRHETLILTTDQPEGKTLTLTDTSGKTTGYIGSQFYYDPVTFSKAINKINEGIKRYPDRLDMRFGKIYVIGQTKDWNNFTKEIIETVRYSKTNQNNWTWTHNEKQIDGKNFMLGSIQDYQLQLYNTGDDKLLKDMRNIANEILSLYPDHVESLSNLSITYLLTNEYDKGIEALLKAEKINPKDFIVLSNIAHGYKLKGDKAKSIEYYEKTIKYGDDEAKEYAKQQIKELKAKK